MARKRVYLDVCCLRRPTDDLSISRNRLEAEAILTIVEHAGQGEWDLLSSEAIEYELRKSADAGRNQAAADLLKVAAAGIDAGEAEYRRAAQLARVGFGALDALHIACAEAGRCDVLLTVDDGLLRKAARLAGLRVAVDNPLSWLLEQTS